MNLSGLILVTGMPGSGKSTLSEILGRRGFKVTSMGDVIRYEAEIQGVEPTPENLGRIAKDIRSEGEAAVARRCVTLLKCQPTQMTVVEGIRSLAEVQEFRKGFKATLIAVHASPETRYTRMSKRGRSDDPTECAGFHVRDRRELGFGIGEAIAMSDQIISNNDTVQNLEKRLDTLLRRLTSP